MRKIRCLLFAGEKDSRAVLAMDQERFLIPTAVVAVGSDWLKRLGKRMRNSARHHVVPAGGTPTWIR